VTPYLRDPAAIYKRSFEIIRAETDVSHLPADAEPVATRIVHACGMPEIVRPISASRPISSLRRKQRSRRASPCSSTLKWSATASSARI
jgi:precorrin isomerase